MERSICAQMKEEKIDGNNKKKKKVGRPQVRRRMTGKQRGKNNFSSSSKIEKLQQHTNSFRAFSALTIHGSSLRPFFFLSSTPPSYIPPSCLAAQHYFLSIIRNAFSSLPSLYLKALFTLAYTRRRRKIPIAQCLESAFFTLNIRTTPN